MKIEMSKTIPELKLTATRQSLSKSAELWLLCVLGVLMSFAAMSTDFYLPAMPQIQSDLNAFTGGVELTISAFLIGFSLGQFIWGPLGDRFGRKPPILAGLVLFIIGAAGCALSDTIWQMIGARIVQALGACAGPVLARAMVRDQFGREKSAQMLSTMMLIMGIAPLIGPLVGGQIIQYGTWHTIFWLLVVIGIISIFCVMSLPETLPKNQRLKTHIFGVFRNYFRLMSDARVMGYVLASAFFYAGIFAYVAGSPFVYISYFHVPPQNYGLLFGVNIIGIMGANMLNARLVTKIGIERLFYWGNYITALSGIMIFITAMTGGGGIFGIAIPLFLFTSMNGMIVANSVAAVMNFKPEQAGTASSLIGALQYGAGVLSAALIGVLNDGTPKMLASMLAIAGIGGLCMALWLKNSLKQN